MTTSDIRAGWNRFFHEPMPATTMAVVRIFYGLLLLTYAALVSADLMVWYSDRGVLPLESAKLIPGGKGLNLLYFLPNTDLTIKLFFSAFVLSSFCVTIGFFTRTTSIISYLLILSLHNRNVMLLHSGDFFLRMMGFWLLFGDCGRAISVDRLIRIAKGRETQEIPMVSPWPVRMIQIQCALLYANAVLWKIRGVMWLDGTAIYYTSRLAEFWRFPTPYVFEHMWTIKLMTWGTLVIEGALGFLLWIKNLRYWILLGGVLLHLGIDWTMNIPLFAPVMIASYLAFVTPADWDRVFAWARAKVNRLSRFTLPIPVFYDGKCSFCTRSVEVVRRLDSLKRFRFIDMHLPTAKAEFPDLDLERGALELLLRSPDGKWLGGYDAFRFMAKHFPALWAILPILYLPPVPQIGRRLYHRIASRRYCILPQVTPPSFAQ